MLIDSENLALKGLDDLFSTEENRQEEQREQVQQIPIDVLYPFTNHPFKVLDDEAMTRTVEQGHRTPKNALSQPKEIAICHNPENGKPSRNTRIFFLSFIMESPRLPSTARDRKSTRLNSSH